MEQLSIDEFGRANGVILHDKPEGVTSHDVVDEYRKKFNTKKVGHAGTLDPFATGALVLLIGKATKLSNDLVGSDKTYTATILFGFNTNTLDPEGDIENHLDIPLELSEKEIQEALNAFMGEIEQSVPIFSSVKVQGHKLRVLARTYDSFKIEDGDPRTVTFRSETKGDLILPLPGRLVIIPSITLDAVSTVSREELVARLKLYNPGLDEGSLEFDSYQAVTITVECSKGTYIRQLAYDIGQELGAPAMLYKLRRTRVGEYSL